MFARRRFACCVAAGALIWAGAAMAQTVPLPWGQNPDMLAWETFVQVTAPAGNPQNTNVEFETWSSDQDIYTANPQWPAAGALKELQTSQLGVALKHQGRVLVIQPNQCTQSYDPQAAKAAGFPSTGCIGEEVRRNWASFQYIVANGLYSTAGLAKAFQAGLKVDMPADSVELKADWIRVVDAEAWLHLTEQQVRSEYYVNSATDGTTKTDFALVSFQFSTKQVKDWVWPDFEHELTPGRCDYIGCHDSFGAAVPDVAPKPQTEQSYGACAKSPALLSMMTNAGLSPVWQHYCLKGVQTTFTTADGQPTKLGNAVIEAINAGVPIEQSSCISCHAYAAFGTGGQVVGPPNPPPLGAVDTSKLKNMVTNDFVWGILFAQ